ncbi:magnesium and cobalt transport protein CorA [Actinokineospora sp. HUAS TT18]|uniref:magnesium and cobalt transport protein CorA n=1 Tax=Actinokineospora sp. HUAS TT18 TaxID=3447451 RepID=UPI003F527BE6
MPLSAVVDCAIYVDGKRLPGRHEPAAAITQVRETGEGFVWIGLFEPSNRQLGAMAEAYGLHELAIEDAVMAQQRPKVERYGDTLFTVLKTVRHVTHESPTTTNEIVETGEIMVFLGPDFILTVRHRDHSGLGDLREELEAAPERLAAGPAAVLHAIADHIVDDYLAATEAFERDIDEVETLVFAPRSPIGAEQMYLMKREIVELRRAVAPLTQPLRVLARTDTALVPTEIRSYFRDVDDHLMTVIERIAGFDEILTTLLNATLAKITLQQNNDMRMITAWAAILAIPTMIAGVYGMNFEYMPELKWKFGYPMVAILVFGACLILYRTFKRNGWL